MSAYRDELKASLGEMIGSLDDLEPLQKFLTRRWLDQLLWMEEERRSPRSATTGCGSSRSSGR